MKIAVAADDRVIAGHFGLCQDYIVFNAEDGKITGEEVHKNPGHADGMTPPLFIAGLGVDAAIGGTVAPHALKVMQDAGVDVVLGASGGVKEAVEAYLAGTLKMDESAIQPCGGC